MKISATRSPNVASNLWSILYSHAVRFFLPLPTATCSLSLSLSLYTSPSRSLTRSFALSFSLSRALALINDQFLSLAPPRLYIALSLTRARIQFLSAKTAGPRVRVSKQTRRTCVLHWRDDITFYFNSPSLIHLPYVFVELSVPWRKRRILPAVEQLSHIRRNFLYCTLNALTNEHFIAENSRLPTIIFASFLFKLWLMRFTH